MTGQDDQALRWCPTYEQAANRPDPDCQTQKIDRTGTLLRVKYMWDCKKLMTFLENTDTVLAAGLADAYLNIAFLLVQVLMLTLSASTWH